MEIKQAGGLYKEGSPELLRPQKFQEEGKEEEEKEV